MLTAAGLDLLRCRSCKIHHLKYKIPFLWMENSSFWIQNSSFYLTSCASWPFSHGIGSMAAKFIIFNQTFLVFDTKFLVFTHQAFAPPTHWRRCLTRAILQAKSNIFNTKPNICKTKSEPFQYKCKIRAFQWQIKIFTCRFPRCAAFGFWFWDLLVVTSSSSGGSARLLIGIGFGGSTSAQFIIWNTKFLVLIHNSSS